MKAFLLDVNVLIALIDPAHQHHSPVHRWFLAHRAQGWATCPLTENGFVRIVSERAYPNLRITPAEAADLLAALKKGSAKTHQFWSDDVSITDPARFDLRALLSGKQVTDAYLVALCVHHRGSLATLDQHIPWRAVPGAKSSILAMIT